MIQQEVKNNTTLSVIEQSQKMDVYDNINRNYY